MSWQQPPPGQPPHGQPPPAQPHPGQSPQWQPGQPQPGAYAPPQKKSGIGKILGIGCAVLVLLMLAVLGGCYALVHKGLSEADKVMKHSGMSGERIQVREGQAFTLDGFRAKPGWKVVPSPVGGLEIKRLVIVDATGDPLDSRSGRSAGFTFRFYQGKRNVNEVNCTSGQMVKGESSAMGCLSFNTNTPKHWDRINVSGLLN